MIGKRAYEMRARTRVAWPVIAKALSLPRGATARDRARGYAQRKGLPPPPPVLTVGEMAYEDRADGYSWEEIRKTLGLSAAHYAQKYAQKYAKKHSKKWPLLTQKDGN